MTRNGKLSTPARYIINAAAVVLLYLLLQTLLANGIIGRYYAKIINLMCVYIVAAVSLNLTCGFLGQLPLGHAGFMAIGAYTSALITKAVVLPGGEDVTFLAALLAGGLVAGMFGILIGLPALRLKGDYLAIITLGFGEMIRVIIQNLGFTGGAMGLQGIPRYTTFTWGYIWVVVTIFVTYTLIHSRQGRAILSIREDEIAAESCGIPTTYFKTLTFTAAAFFAGISGGLLAHHVAFIGPGDFNFMASIEILVMVVLGGMGSIAGSVIAAGVLTLLPELLRAFSDWRMVIYSVLLVVVMIFRPSGLMGRYEFSLGRTLDRALAALRRRPAQKGGTNGD
ncbi:MAG: branched-chain amino acid ABC transporter permease [Oscillospiraceae bacterium]|nr:branched-chain amino acid ABC transporter permease [Oscillospiraceae bacterium]